MDRANLKKADIEDINAAGEDTIQAVSQDSPVKSLLRAVVVREAAPIVPGHMNSSLFAGMLNMMACPLLVIDRSLHIHFSNLAADEALDKGGMLCRKNQFLRIEPPSLAFVEAISATTRNLAPGRQSMILSGAKGQSVAVWIEPFPTSLQNSDGIWCRGLAVVAFRPLPSQPKLSAHLLCQHYLLTQKEAEVACHLARGSSLGDIVKLMQIKRSTVRSHLAKCFIKTATRRQPDLVALVLALASPMLE